MSSGIHIDSVTQILDNFNVDIGFICPHLYKYSLVILVGIGSKENGKNRRLIKTSFQWIQLLHFPDHFRVSLSHFRLRTDRGFDTSVCASQSTSDNFESEAVSSSCSNVKELREHDEHTCTSCISDRECTLSNISTEKFHCSKSTVFEPCTCKTLSASVFHVEGKREGRYTLKG